MPVVDLAFRLHGQRIPVDHGYQLYSAISRLIPELHSHDSIGIHPISGPLAGNRSQLITDKSSLIIRLPSERIGDVLSLAGKSLKIGEHEIRVGVPQTRALVPSARVYSRLVVIKGFTEPDSFLDATVRQLDSMSVKGKPYLVQQAEIEEANRERSSGTHSPFLRRTIRIRDKEIVGFALRIEELTAEESVLLQEKGIGGRRRFGCGIFVPDRRF
jgi:CRISPR-associated protein Cas6